MSLREKRAEILNIPTYLEHFRYRDFDLPLNEDLLELSKKIEQN